MTDLKVDKASTLPMKTQVENLICGKILSGEWEAGRKIPSERELSEILQVSRKTVRNAILTLTERQMVSRSTGQGTYVRSRVPYHFDGERATGNIGYVLCKSREERREISREPFYFEVLTQLRNDLAEEKFHLLFSFLDEEDQGERKEFQTFLDRVDGLIIYEAGSRAFLEDLAKAGVPTILLQPNRRAEEFDRVSFDLEQGARLGVERLLALGHRRIAMIGGPERYLTAQVRREGYRSALAGAELPFKEERFAAAEDWRKEGGRRAMKEILAKSGGVSAVFCATDALATGAVAAISEAGLAIPGDISVVGFDDSILAEHCHPPLSSVKLNVTQMAGHAARRMVERLRNPGLLPLKVRFPAELVLRGSCREEPRP